MAGYGKVGATVRITSLLIIIFVLIFGVAPLLFRVLGLPGMGNPLFTWVTRSVGLTGSSAASSTNSIDLIEQERLQMLSKTLDDREFELTQKEAMLANKLDELEAREEIITAQEKELEERAEIIAIRMSWVSDLDRNLLLNAQNLSNMPPTQAVAILENISSDQVLIDHLLAADRYALAQSMASLSSVWLSMMNAERAGRVMEKMATPS